MAAYFIVDQLKVTDPDTMKTYAAGVGETVKAAGGKMLVRGGDLETVEGDYQHRRMFVIEFADMAALKGWYDGLAYDGLKKMRLASSRANAVMVEGV